MEQKTVKWEEIQVSYKPKKNPVVTITESKDMYDFIIEHYDGDEINLVESFHAIFLNRMNRVVGYHLVSKGGVSGTVCDPKVIFMRALIHNASGIILAHNHPSGNLRPSDQDIKLTKKIQNGAQILDMNLLDHIIVDSDNFYSFADEGML